MANMVESLPPTEKNNWFTRHLSKVVGGLKRGGLTLTLVGGSMASPSESFAQTTIACQLYNSGEIRCPNVNNYQQPQYYQDSACPSNRYFRRNDGSFACDSSVSYPNQYPTVTYNPDYVSMQPATRIVTSRSISRSSIRAFRETTTNGFPTHTSSFSFDETNASFNQMVEQIFGPGARIR